MSDDPAATLERVLASPDTRAILEAACVDWLPYEAFLEMRLPSMVSPRQAWRLLQALRRAMGIFFPSGDVFEVQLWYSVTYRILSMLSEIDRTCSSETLAGSQIFSTKASCRAARLRARTLEFAAVAEMDGFAVPRRSSAAQPALPVVAERLARNSGNLANSLGEYVEHPFSLELAQEFQEMALRGIKPSALKHARTPGVGALQTLDEAVFRRTTNTGDAVAAIMAYANEETGERLEHHAIRALIFFNAIRALRPLSDCNNIVARALYSLYLRKHDLPLLSVVPIAHEFLESLRADAGAPGAAQEPTFGLEPDSTEFDATGGVTLALALLVNGLRRLEDDIRAAEERDRAVLAMLSGDARFNRRQLLLLGRALAAPDWVFTIAAHQAIHGVTYATARKDLMVLERAGYLIMRQDGRAHTFIPVEDLEQRFGAPGRS